MTFHRIVIGAAVAALLALRGIGTGGVRMEALDVGQGDAFLVSDGRRQLLVDAGPDGSVLARVGAAMPFTDRVIETALITHPHRDHYEGFRHVLLRYRVDTLLVAEFADAPEAYRGILALAEARGTRIVRVAAGDAILIGERLRADVLWPPRGEYDADPDDGSIALALRVAGDAAAFAVLTGDAAEGVEFALVERGAVPHARVLKAGHHGSATSSSEAFLAAVAPEHVVMSVGAENRYGHPSPTVLHRFRERGLDAWRTDLAGSIRFTWRPDGVRARSCRILCLP
jgi:competence protein ComEC